MDETESVRREIIAMQQANIIREREVMEAKYGQVWNTKELIEDFEVIGFMAPIAVVRRRSDGVKGSLEFQHDPRFYWGWSAH